MGWKKRPSNIKTSGESVRIPLYIGLFAQETQLREKARKDLGPEIPDRITFDDL